MASLNLNKVLLVGRLTADPELRTTTSGVSVISFTVAVNRNYKQNDQTEADFINCVAWRNSAEFLAKYFKKGDSVYIGGAIQVRKYTTQNNETRYAVEVVADEVRFVDSKSNSPADKANGTYIPEAYQTAPQLVPMADDDDLPF